MEKISIKNFSLLALVLMAASAVTAAIVPDKANSKRVNNGTLRAFSATAGSVDQDAPQLVVSCLALPIAVSCTATNSCTTTAFFTVESCCLLIEGAYHQTIGNTSQTANLTGDQNSVLQQC